MDQDNDVERLFSWLQTPEIRYREFAGAREVTNSVVTVRSEVSKPVTERPPSHNAQLSEEYPEDQYPDQSQTVIKVEPAPEPVRHEPTIVAPAPLPPTSAPVARPETEAETPASAPSEPPAAETHDENKGRSLDSVFNRLSGGRSG